MHWCDRYIEQIPGIQGGEPVIAGTRTPVRSVVGYDKIYHGDVAEVLRALSHLSAYQVGAALDYYRDHKSEIDVYITQNEEAFQRFMAAP
jgi:uncharacterized protein (DUF433 family)